MRVHGEEGFGRQARAAAEVEDARRALKGEFSSIAQDIIDIGSSAGGARAKAVIGWNRQTNQVVSGQFDVPEGFGQFTRLVELVGGDEEDRQASRRRWKFYRDRGYTLSGVDMLIQAARGAAS